MNKLDILSNYFSFKFENFIHIKYLYPKCIPICNDFILTSSTAVKSLINLFSINFLKNKNYYLVGEKTEKILRIITQNIHIVAEDSLSLSEQLIKINKQKFVYFGSNRRILTIENKLFKNGQNIQRIDSYKTLLNPIKINQIYDGIVFLSPSSVESFFILNKKIPKNTLIFAIGKTTKLSFDIYTKYFNSPLSIIIPDKINLIELLNCIKKQFNIY